MEFLFESMDDMAAHLDRLAAKAREKSKGVNMLVSKQRAYQGEASGFEQAAFIVRNSRFADIAA